MILDGAFVAQMLSPRTLNTFQDFSNIVFLPYIFGQLQSVRRLDIVWDVYLADSLKAGTKSKRGQGQRRKVLPLAPLPSTWKSFLKNDENKTHLPSPENSVAQSSSLKIAQLASQCCSRGQMGYSTATVSASVHFIVACVVYYLNDTVSASCEVFVVSSVVASRLATAFLTGN